MNIHNFIQTKYNEPFIVQRADPYVYRHEDGSYLFTASVPEYDRIVLRQSDTLDGLQDAEEVTIWKRHETGKMSMHIWAPEIHFIEGKWFLYFAASEKDDIWALRPYVLECTGSDPIADPWIEKGQMQAADDFSFQDFSLDMTVFKNQDKWYCVWAEKVSVGKKISNLYIAELESPCRLSTAQVLLTSPDYDWERVDFWVNEGPSLLRHEDKLYLTYSASATGACYCMGMLSISSGADLLDPHAWKKERLPIMKTDWEKGILGPGHNSFTKSEDGKEDIMIYHARQYDEIEGDPLYDPNRHTYRMKILWDKDGRPVFDMTNNF
ncbi:MAG: family 43 glycosylhydrolase [Faecalicatena sp.]|uniref:glycoside hydrolase family 43 protein n=1 Tax=Faecalicatena sp. TaxID=2005360 RepID=UPI002588C4E7|nr:family 43 glycosylhydrolase [Faecalicatena sp.]MCI6464689.1 family 43 glycosylhydrolase [Faecalicatena sp.]MDY5618267.1 family 43 glycosylhydrolase [Lachnospiraceae bacterium]